MIKLDDYMKYIFTVLFGFRMDTTEEINITIVESLSPFQPFENKDWQIFIIIFIGLFSLFGNGGTIYIHMKQNKKYQGKIYVISLACIDIFACLTVLPLHPYIEKSLIYAEDDTLLVKISYSLSGFVLLCNLYILVLVALDRFLAVYFVSLHNLKMNVRAICLVAIVIICAAIAGILTLIYRNSDRSDPMNMKIDKIMVNALMTAFVLIVVIYAMIIYKLYRHEGKTVPTPSRDEAAYNRGADNVWSTNR